MTSLTRKVLFFLAIYYIAYNAMAGTIKSSAMTSGNLFAANLFSVITKTHPIQNVIYSPASIQTCMAFAFAGADGETADELRKVLHLGEGDRQTVIENYEELISKSFNSPKNDGPILKMANRMFVNEKIKIKPEFQKITKKSFESEAENLNFGDSQTAVSHINNWVEQQTENRIQNLLQPDAVDDDTSAIVVNAIYFKGKWAQPFSDSSTEKTLFFTTANEKNDVDMMYQDNKFNYADLPEYNAKALEMKYLNSDLSMLIILPNEYEGLAQLETKLEGVDLNEIVAKMSEEDVDVFLPKFRIEFDMDLTKTLKEMGLRKMFSNSANFSHMFESSVPQKVSEVVHKAFLDVNEAGSEAAAATFYKIVLMSLNFNQKVFRADHPFVFAIRSTNAVFFAGHVATL